MNIQAGKSGYVALMAVLIIGAVTLDIAITATVVSIMHNKNGLIAQNLSAATDLANACGEKALMDLKENPDYAGNETVALTRGTCEILPIENLGGDSRRIQIVGSANNDIRKLQIDITSINPTMNVSSWVEMVDFN